MSKSGMVIVGAGEAGARAVIALREQGYAGSITLVGDEPHGPYERPPLSKAVMAISEDPRPTFILDGAKCAAANILHIAGVQATSVDRAAHRLLLEDGRTIPYDKLLIATGARARRLAAQGTGTGDILYLRNFSDALRLRETLTAGTRLVVVGGGFIGLEIAASAVARSCRVTLLESGPRILGRGVPGSVAAHVAARHEAAGLDLRTQVQIERIDRAGSGVVIRLVDGSIVEADAVVAGVGAVPEAMLAQSAGLTIDNGIRVDDRLRTEDPDIFAAGDCCSFPHPLYGGRRIRLEAWRNAQDQGALAARNMLGADEVYAAVPWFWSDQYDETLQVAGLSDEGADVVERDLGSGRLFLHLDPSGRLVAASGVGPNGVIAREVRVAEMLIARRAHPDREALANPTVKLKALLAA